MVLGLTEFDSERAYQNARSLSFPRETGSDGEKRAVAYIAKRFKDMGLEVKEEEFPLILSPWILLKIGLIIGLLLVLLSRLIVYRYPLIASFIIFTLLLSLIFTGPIWQWFARKGVKDPWGRKKSSKNIIARFRPPLPPFNSPLTKGGYRGVTTLYLMAHYDSKSQSLSLGARIIWTSAIFLGCLLLGLNYLLFALGSPHGGIRDGIFLFIVLSVLILFFNKSDNLSPGGLDNAGGIGLLLELAEVLSRNPPRNLNIIFVSTGAEEEGLMGAHAFLKAYSNELDPERSFILNFDGIGIKGKLRVFSKIKGLPKALNKLPSWPVFSGLMMDHIPFKSHGFKAVSLGSVSKEAFKIHTYKDTVDLINQEGIEEAGIIVREVIEGLKGG
jgi:hypothetical protein